MQAKDIPDEAFLDAIREVQRRRGNSTASRWRVAAVLAGHPEHVDTDRTFDYPHLPEKVLLAKARRLIRRGLIDGCACGCRGDFELA